MQISLTDIGKKFGSEWIFRKVNHVFNAGSATVILGSNGSGKSTLLQVVSGYVIPSEGQLEVSAGGKIIPQENLHTMYSFASPYMDLMDDFTFRESAEFQAKFRKWKSGLDTEKIIELSGLRHAADKQIRHFSSGMKQRAKLALAILSDTPVLLLDEPCSNLDQRGCEWYAGLINDFRDKQTVIVCSNEVKEEFFFCKEKLKIEDFKPAR